MPKYIQIDNGVVTGYLEAAGEPSILPAGRSFKEVEAFPPLLSTVVGDVITPPAPPPDFGVAMEPRDFFYLFPLAVRKALREAAQTNDNVADILEMIQMAGVIRTKHPRILALLQKLVQAGLLTQAEADRISRGEEGAE